MSITQPQPRSFYELLEQGFGSLSVQNQIELLGLSGLAFFNRLGVLTGYRFNPAFLINSHCLEDAQRLQAKYAYLKPPKPPPAA